MGEDKCCKASRKRSIITALVITVLVLLMLVSIAGAMQDSMSVFDKELENEIKASEKAIDPETDIIYQNQALSFNPLDSVAWYNIGLDLAHLNKYDGAIKAYNRAIEINPLNEFAWEAKKFALNKLNR